MKISREAGKPPDFRHRPPAIARDRVLFLHLRYIAGELVYLVDVLLQQHQGGRKVTDITMQFATNQALKNLDDRRKLADSLRQFIRMYNPHEAREDTILFPEFRKIVSKNEYDSLGEDFEKKEHELFGEDGFEQMVDKVAGIEKKLGIYDLAQFTPNV